LLTQTELRAASQLDENTLENAARAAASGKYMYVVLGIDWGGGGEEEISFTTYAVVGMRPDGVLECIYGYRSRVPHDQVEEARIALRIASATKCHVIAHDFSSGAGAYREKYLVEAGWPIDRIAPISYVRAPAQRVMYFVPPTELQPRGSYRVDRPRALVLVCHEIKFGRLLFFREQNAEMMWREGAAGLVDDFLALVEDKHETATGLTAYNIIRKQNMTDDFAQAVTFACVTLWHIVGQWPDTQTAVKYEVPPELVREAIPTGKAQLPDELD
jgi:hypothetical protein